MHIQYKKLSEITPYEKNPRKNDEAVDYVAKSIEEFGFKVPIITDKNGVIVAGHTRYKASKKLHYKDVPCIVADDLSEEQIKAFRLADNKVAEKAEWDFDLLTDELEDIQDIDMADFGFEFDWEDSRYDIPNDEKAKLKDKFLVPPFSVFDTKQGYWQERKKMWRDAILDKGEARGDANLLTLGTQKNFANVSILDPVLSEIIIRYFMPNKECGVNCFDVFAGDTVFGYVASTLGKRFTGIELRVEQVEFNNNRIKELNTDSKYICDDGRNVCKHIEKESQDLFFSCPPYFDLEVYSNKENDASNQKSFDTFYQILDKAFTEAIQCLKEDRFAVVVVGDVRDKKDGHYYDFMGKVKETFKREGLLLYNEAILLDVIGTACLRATRYMHTRKLAKVHQNILVFYKGNTKKITKNFDAIEIRKEEEYASENV